MPEPRTPARAGSPPAASEADAQQARRQAERLHLPFDPLETPPDDASLWAETPLELLVRFACVPVGREDGRLVLAFGGLDDLERVDDAEFHLGQPIEAVVAPAPRVAERLKRHRAGEPLLEQASEPLRLHLAADDETPVQPAL